jgi:hypothetical protein
MEWKVTRKPFITWDGEILKTVGKQEQLSSLSSVGESGANDEFTELLVHDLFNQPKASSY